MRTTQKVLTKKNVATVTTAESAKIMGKKETFRSYLYTGKTNKNWIAKGAKVFGSESRFIDAVITAARKTKLEVKAPNIKKTAKAAKKKTTKRTSKKVLH